MFYPFLVTKEEESATNIEVPIDVLERCIHEEYIRAIEDPPKQIAIDKFIDQEEMQC